jgi:hypothetical protein
VWSRAHDALDGRPDEDIPQQQLAMRTHHDEIRTDGPGTPQNAVERIAGDDQRAALGATQFGHCADLLRQDPLGLAHLDFHEVLRPVIIHDMNESQLGSSGLREQACSPQRPLGTCREVRRCENLHFSPPVRNSPALYRVPRPQACGDQSVPVCFHGRSVT